MYILLENLNAGKNNDQSINILKKHPEFLETEFVKCTHVILCDVVKSMLN